MKYIKLSGSFLFLIIAQVYADTSPLIPCQKDPVKLAARSSELQEIAKEDDNDRIDWEHKPSDHFIEVEKRDEERRKKVAEIFAEGCFSKAGDYAAAALVYQHGNTADHYFQTFIWSKRAIELGDEKQKHLMALGIDRYLINIGHKQLFRTQAKRIENKSDSCWCLPQTENKFPEKKRLEYGGRSRLDANAWLKKLNEGNSCPVTECTDQLESSPKGTVLGFW